MPLDTSMYPQAPTPFNPLEAAMNANQLMGLVNQNKLFQQQFAARQAIGPIYQQAIDPATGVLDTNKLLAEAAKNPATAWMAGDLAQQALGRQLNQVQIQQSLTETQKAQLDKAIAEATFVRSTIGSLAAKENPTNEDVTAGFVDLVDKKIISAQRAIAELQNVPVNDPVKLKEYLQQQNLAVLDAEARLKAVYPDAEQVESGGATNFVRFNRLTGKLELAGTLPKSMSPAEAAEPVEMFDPATNQMRTITKGQFARMQGAGGGAPAAVPPGGPGAAPAALPPAGPGLPAAPPLGTEAAATEAATGAAKAMNDMYAEVRGSAPRIFQLRKALGALQQTGTGPGTETRNYLTSLFTSLPGVRESEWKWIAELKDDAKFYDEANKYLQQYAQGQAASLGAGTDAKLASALSANASTKISNLAAQDVVKANIGLERYKQAQAQAFEAANVQPENFNKWAANWNRKIDPRVFVFDLMTTEQQKALVKEMKAEEKKTFVATHQWAKQNGLLD